MQRRPLRDELRDPFDSMSEPAHPALASRIHEEIYVPSSFFTAEPGNQFARVTVRFENHASDEKHADPFQFVLKDQQGVKHAITSAGDSWSGVNLTPGGTFGPRSLDFQVTKGTTAGALIWTPDLRDHEIPLT
jgi:hypothetical protein